MKKLFKPKKIMKLKKLKQRNKIEVIKKDITIARENIEKQQKEAAGVY